MSQIAYECSECHTKYRVEGEGDKFCPNCNATMKKMESYNAEDFRRFPYIYTAEEKKDVSESGTINTENKEEISEGLIPDEETENPEKSPKDDTILMGDDESLSTSDNINPENENGKKGEPFDVDAELAKAEISPEEANLLDAAELENDIIVKDESMLDNPENENLDPENEIIQEGTENPETMVAEEILDNPEEPAEAAEVPEVQ